MNRQELEEEIRETRQTFRHLAQIGEIDTSIAVAKYLNQLLEMQKSLPTFKLVKRDP